MNYENFKPNFSKPTVLTAKQYDTKVSYELENSDTSIDDVMVGMLTLLNGLGYSHSTINGWIKEAAANVYDDEREILKEALNEWKVDDNDEDLYNEVKEKVREGLDKKKAEDFRSEFGGWTTDEQYEGKFKEFGDEDDEMIEEEIDEEDYKGQFKDWDNETPIEEEFDEEVAGRRMDIIGQNGNEGTHYSYEWDDNIKGYEYESNDILHNINDSITIIKDRMEDIDMRMDNIDEQLGILNADVANIEFNIQHPIKEALLNAKVVYDKSVIETERFNKVKEAAMRYSDEVKAKHVPIKDLDVVDMETGEVSVDGGFDGKGFKTPKVLGKWQTDNKTKEVVKLDKTKVRKGKIKDLKK